MYRGESKRDKIRDQTIRLELGIISLKEMTELAQLRRSGHVTRTVDTLQWPSQLEHRERDPKKTPTYLQKILKERGTEWKALRATVRARDRGRAVCKLSTPTDRRGSISEE